MRDLVTVRAAFRDLDGAQCNIGPESLALPAIPAAGTLGRRRGPTGAPPVGTYDGTQ